MVAAQAGCTLDAALELMVNTAQATDETLHQMAYEVVQRHVSFE